MTTFESTSVVNSTIYEEDNIFNINGRVFVINGTTTDGVCKSVLRYYIQ